MLCAWKKKFGEDHSSLLLRLLLLSFNFYSLYLLSRRRLPLPCFALLAVAAGFGLFSA